MACLAVGIIKGIANFYNQSGRVNIVPTTNPNDERVQIRIEFCNKAEVQETGIKETSGSYTPGTAAGG